MVLTGYTLVTGRAPPWLRMPPNFGYGMVTLWSKPTEWLHFGYGRVLRRLRNASKLWLRNGYTLVTEGSRVDCGMPPMVTLWLRNGYTLVTEGSRVDCGMPEWLHCQTLVTEGYGMVTLWLRKGPVSIAECLQTLVTEWLHFGYGMVTLWLRKGPVSIAECLQTLVAEWLHFGSGRVPCRLRNASKLYGMVTLWLRKGPVSIAECLQTLVTEWIHFGYGRVPCRLRNASKLWLRNGHTFVTEGPRVVYGMPPSFGYGMATHWLPEESHVGCGMPLTLLRLRKAPMLVAERL